MNPSSLQSYRGLTAFQKGFLLAMRIYNGTKDFPAEEKYSLTDQVRRSSRSVCVNLAEGYRKRRYQAHFLAKISDADMENTETQVWLDFALECGYVSNDFYNECQSLPNEIGRLLFHILEHPERYGSPTKTTKSL